MVKYRPLYITTIIIIHTNIYQVCPSTSRPPDPGLMRGGGGGGGDGQQQQQADDSDTDPEQDLEDEEEDEIPLEMEV